MISNRFSGSSKAIYVLFVIAFAAGIPSVVMAQMQMDRNQIDQISMAVVQIHTPTSEGSGSLVEGTNLIYTNRHVAEGYYNFDIHALLDLTDTALAVFRAELVGYSDTYDFAVLRITETTDGRPVDNPHAYLASRSDSRMVPALQMASSADIPGRGDQTAVFGYPGIGDNELVITTGIISSVQYDEVYGERMPVWYRTNAEMSPGNSGGVATNMQGEMIGIPTYVRTESVTGGRLGSVLSIQVVNKILEHNALESDWDNLVSGTVGSMYGSEQLDFRLDPTFGSVNLSGGFIPDPYSVSLISGGEINASYITDEGCIGFASASPDFRLQWSASGELPLIMYFEPDVEGNDTVLLINKPDGSWMCNDDAHELTLDPLVEINNPSTGQYDIWIASYDEGEYHRGMLHITEMRLLGPAPVSVPEPEGGLSVTTPPDVYMQLDFAEPPQFGSVSLKTGFLPDPYTQRVTSGGSVDVSGLGLGSDCIGFAGVAPDFRLNWSGSAANLNVMFVADNSSDDTVLIVNAPNRSWNCNDDAHPATLNPMVNLSGLGEGQYDIWVASYSRGEYISGTLKITEYDARP